MESTQVTGVCLYREAAVRLLAADFCFAYASAHISFCHLQFLHNKRVLQERSSDLQVGQNNDFLQLAVRMQQAICCLFSCQSALVEALSFACEGTRGTTSLTGRPGLHSSKAGLTRLCQALLRLVDCLSKR